uniref:CD8+ T-cell target antigen Tp9 n=1 Tax=Theileria parva lawrencei TaxID=1148490 RepID=H9A5K7_THEPA|nr:CD8+ T-cell target antigen Tp9 [Theileria parva lawrencei]
MNVLTTGIILYSFYTCLCMNSDDDDDDAFGAEGGSMLPRHKRSSMFSEPLGSTFTSGYSDDEFEEKFKRMGMKKKPKDKLGRTNQPQPGTVGGYGQPGYPSQPQAAGAYGGGYPTQQGGPGYPPPPAAAGAQGHAYPPGYGQPVAAGGYGGGASGGAGGYGGGYPSQPGGPQGAAGPPGQPIMMKIDVKNRRNPNTKLDRFTLTDGRTQHAFRANPGYAIKQVNYDGDRVWSMDGGNFGTEVLVDPIGSGAKTMTIKLANGDNVIYTKPGRNKPWTKQ